MKCLCSLAIICLFALSCGCADSASPPLAKKAYSRAHDSDAFDKAAMGGMGMGGMGMAQDRSESEGSQRSSAIDNRKIIYSANLQLVVEDFDPVESAIRSLVKKHGAFIADATMGARNTQKRSGTWTIRTPADRFDDFLTGAGEIGVVVSRSRNSQDVTEEYVDIQARITNKKKLESRIIQLLERPDDKIQHVIEVERELGRVREDIERMEGRIRFLSDRVELTTVTITVSEEKEPQPVVATGFAARVSQAWQNSLASARRGIENFIVWLAGNAIALVVWILIGLIALIVVRRVVKKGRAVHAPA